MSSRTPTAPGVKSLLYRRQIMQSSSREIHSMPRIRVMSNANMVPMCHSLCPSRLSVYSPSRLSHYVLCSFYLPCLRQPRKNCCPLTPPYVFAENMLPLHLLKSGVISDCNNITFSTFSSTSLFVPRLSPSLPSKLFFHFSFLQIFFLVA